MYAIIATGGKQYKVAEGDIINVEKLGAEAGETVTFDQRSCCKQRESESRCSTVAAATVTASVVKNAKAKKVIVYKYKTEIWLSQKERPQTAVHSG